MKKERIPLPADLKRQLLIECGFKCSMNRCDREISLEFHHIDANPANNSQDNIIVFCSIHHHLADIGKIDRKTCVFLKTSLQEVNEISGKITELKSRNIFFKETIKALGNSSELRATFV